MVKYVLICCAFTVFPFGLSAQVSSAASNPGAFPADEVSISVNNTLRSIDNYGSSNIEYRYGYGFGVYHIFRPLKQINPVFGIEYNRTGEFRYYDRQSNLRLEKNVEYRYNRLSFPLTVRFNVGHKSKMFIEPGAFSDIVVSAKRQGTVIVDYPNTHEESFKERVGAKTSWGVQLGVGIQIPVSKYALVVKPEYRWANNVTYCRLFLGFRFQ